MACGARAGDAGAARGVRRLKDFALEQHVADDGEGGDALRRLRPDEVVDQEVDGALAAHDVERPRQRRQRDEAAVPGDRPPPVRLVPPLRERELLGRRRRRRRSSRAKVARQPLEGGHIRVEVEEERSELRPRQSVGEVEEEDGGVVRGEALDGAARRDPRDVDHHLDHRVCLHGAVDRRRPLLRRRRDAGHPAAQVFLLRVVLLRLLASVVRPRRRREERAVRQEVLQLTYLSRKLDPL